MTGSLPFMVTQNLDFLKYPPASTLFIMVLCFGVTLITTYISRRTTNIEDYKRIQTESTHAQQELMAAKRSGNQRRIQRAGRDDEPAALLRVEGWTSGCRGLVTRRT